MKNLKQLTKKIHLKDVSLYLGIGIIAAAVFYLGTIYFFNQFEQLGIRSQLRPDHIFFRLVKSQREAMNTILLISTSITLVLSIAIGYIGSHLRRKEIQVLLYGNKEYHEEIPKSKKDKEEKTREFSAN